MVSASPSHGKTAIKNREFASHPLLWSNCYRVYAEQSDARDERAIGAVRAGGRIAYPNGVAIEPSAHAGVHIRNYDASRRQEAITKLHHLIDAGPFEIHVSRTFPPAQVADAHRAIEKHFLGKLALRLSEK